MSPSPSPSISSGDIIDLAKSPTSILPPSISSSTLLSLLSSPSTPTSTYVTSLLALLSRSPPNPSLLSSLLLAFLSLPRDAASRHVIHLFSLLLPSLPSLSPVLELLVSDLGTVSDPEDAVHLELIPPSLALALREGDGERFVDEIVAADWTKVVVVKMAALLREFPLEVRSRVPELVEKVFAGIGGVDVQDLPAVVYQLLLLASKGFCRRLVVAGVMEFFGSGSVKGSPAIVRQVEGTVLMHVNFAVKQDPLLGQEVMSIVRKDPRMFSHFSVLALLSIAKVRRFNQGVVGLLRSVVVAAYKDYKVARGCSWLPDSLKEETMLNLKRLEKSLLKAVNESNSGREHMVPSIVQLGFVLLECVDGEGRGGSGNFEEFMGVEELGIQMLKILFEVHDMARNEVIDQCKSRILSLKPQQSTAIIRLLSFLVRNYPYPMLEHIARLKELMDYFTLLHDKDALSLVISIVPLTKFNSDLQNYIVLALRKALFRKEVSVRLAAIHSIIHLILEENKSLKVGMNTLQESSSQASSSQQVDISCKKRYGLFEELNGLLRRCLSEEAKVKEVLYHGLVKLVILEPLIAGPVLDFLWPHFSPFFSKKDARFPLVIDACVNLVNDNVRLNEPLDCLLSCISWILLLQPHGKCDAPSEFSRVCLGFSLSLESEIRKTSSRDAFSNALSKIRLSFRGVSLEDILGQSEGPNSYSSQGEKISCRIWILSGILEVFINIVAADLEKAASTDKEDLEAEVTVFAVLFESLEKEKCISKQRNYAKKLPPKNSETLDKKNNDCQAVLMKLSQERRPFLSTSSIHCLLLTAAKLYANNLSEKETSQNNNQSSCKLLGDCLKLMSFSLKVCHHQVKYFSHLETDDPWRSLVIGDIKLVGEPLLLLIWLLKSRLKLERDHNVTANRKKAASPCVEQLCLSLSCLNELFKATSQKLEFVDLIKNLVSLELSGLGFEETWAAHVNIEHSQILDKELQKETMVHFFLEKRVQPLYLEFLDVSFFQGCEILSEMILAIGSKLPSKLKDLHGAWAETVCRSTEMIDPRVSRRVVGLAFLLKSPPDDLIIAQTLGSEMLKVLYPEETSKAEKSEKFPVINTLTGSAIAIEVLQFSETLISHLGWMVLKLKKSNTSIHEIGGSSKSDKIGKPEYRQLLDDVLYSRLEALVNLFSSFTEMKLTDSLAEQFLKLNGRFYKILAQVAKHQISPKGCKQSIPGQNFQKLAEITCKLLTAPLYNFVACVQKNQQESEHRKGIFSKIRRENRCIPDLIFQIEDYEKYLIRLSKLSKVNLLRHAKRSTTRDFKIIGTDGSTTHERNSEEPCETSNLSQHESGEACVPDEEQNDSEELMECSIAAGPTVADSESDTEIQEDRDNRAKRCKRNSVVQDSDEDE